MGRKLHWFLRVAILSALLASAIGGSAAAHGILEGSSPPANAVLPSAPRQVILVFNEPVDQEFSAASVQDRNGRKVSGKAAFSKDGGRMTVPVDAVTPGAYTVRWRVLSTADGHTTSGFLIFSVGESAPASQPSARTDAPDPLIVAFRWLGYLAAILLTGAVFFQSLVLGPGARVPVDAAARLRSLAVVSGASLLVSLCVEFLLQAAVLLDISVLRVATSGMLWPLMVGTKAGWSLIVRASMAVLLLIPSTQGGRILRAAALIWFIIVSTVITFLGGLDVLEGTAHGAVIVLVGSVYGLISVMMALIVPKIPDLRIPEGAWVTPLTAALLLAGITLSSHAAGSGVVASVVDWVHLLAAATWIGGLGAFLTIVRGTAPSERKSVMQFLVPRISRIAAISLGALILTGTISAWIHIPALRAFVVTAYGRTLLVKILFILPLVLLGALSRFALRPRIQAGTADAAVLGRFVRSASAEVVLGSAVLLAVAVLTMTPPATVTLPAVTRSGVVYAGLTEDAKIRLTISPAAPRWTRFEVTVGDRQGEPLPGASAYLRFLKLDQDLEPTQLPVAPQGQGRFVAEGADLTIPGWWEVSVILREPGRSDAVVAFPFQLGASSSRTSDPVAVRLVEKVSAVMKAVRTWREVEQITDGAGNVVVTRYEAVRPDRLRYRTSSEVEAVIVGATRYLREGGGPWARDRLPSPVALEGPYAQYFRGAEAITLGRSLQCGEESCRVVMWEIPAGAASFAAQVGNTSHRVMSLFMVAPGHYMTSRAYDLNAPLAITPPR